MNKSLVIITENGEDDFTVQEREALAQIYHIELYSCKRLLEPHEFISMAYSGQLVAIEGHLAPNLDEELLKSLPFLEEIFISEPLPFTFRATDIKIHVIDNFIAQSLAEEALLLLLSLARNKKDSSPAIINGLTAGFIGLNPAAMYMAKLLGAFGMNVIYHDPSHEKSSIGFSMNFFDVLSRSNCIFFWRSIDGKSTLINDEICNVFRGGAFLISLVDPLYYFIPSIIDAIKRDIIDGAAFLKSHYKRAQLEIPSHYNFAVSSNEPALSTLCRKGFISELTETIKQSNDSAA